MTLISGFSVAASSPEVKDIASEVSDRRLEVADNRSGGVTKDSFDVLYEKGESEVCCVESKVGNPDLTSSSVSNRRFGLLWWRDREVVVEAEEAREEREEILSGLFLT